MLGFREVDIWSRHHEIHAMRGQITASCLWNACRIMTLGVTLIGLGVTMATIGYCQQPPVSNPAYRPLSGLLDGSQPTRPLLGADGITYRHLSYLGSVIMGIGGFVVVASCVMTFEARDSASKIVPARYRPSQEPRRPDAPCQQSAASQTQPWHLLPPRPACLLWRTASAPCTGRRRAPRGARGSALARRYQPVPGSPRPRSATARWRCRRSCRPRCILEALRANSLVVRSIATDVSELPLPCPPPAEGNGNCSLAPPPPQDKEDSAETGSGRCRDVVVCVELAADDDVITCSSEVCCSPDDDVSSGRSVAGSPPGGSASDTDGSDICDEVAPLAEGDSDCPEDGLAEEAAPENDNTSPSFSLSSVTNCLPVTTNGGHFLVVQLSSGTEESAVDRSTSGAVDGSTSVTADREPGIIPAAVPAVLPAPAAVRGRALSPDVSLKTLRSLPVFSEVLNSASLSPDSALSVLDGLGGSDSSSEASDVTVVLAKPSGGVRLLNEPLEPPNSVMCHATAALTDDDITPDAEETCGVLEEVAEMPSSCRHQNSTRVFYETEVNDHSKVAAHVAAEGHDVTSGHDPLTSSEDTRHESAGRDSGARGECGPCGVRVVVTSSPSPPGSPAGAPRRPGSWHGGRSADGPNPAQATPTVT